MNRCFLPLSRRFAATAVAVLAGVAALPPAAAQDIRRPFPPAALRGILVVTAPPAIQINGRDERLSPGARIRSTSNTLAMSGSLVGQRLLVNYVRDPHGLVHEVWILTETEAQERRPGLETVFNFQTASDADRPKRDDGKTPFHELPKFPNQ